MHVCTRVWMCVSVKDGLYKAKKRPKDGYRKQDLVSNMCHKSKRGFFEKRKGASSRGRGVIKEEIGVDEQSVIIHM